MSKLGGFMTEQTKRFILSCIESERGDDYARAKHAFRNYTPEQMKQQYGRSGQTCQEILDGYKRFEDRIDEAIREINKIPTT
jgi:hypothetical protein